MRISDKTNHTFQNMKQFNCCYLLWVLLLSACKAPSGESGNVHSPGDSGDDSKPNIIFILVDDLGYADVGFNGSTYYETPALDALAQDGLVLDRSYMYPSCSPSRTCYFTGKQSFRTGVYTVPVLETGTDQENIFSRWTVGREHPIFMEELVDVGYQGIHLGKWHIVGPYPQEELAMDWPIKQKLTQPKPWDFSWVSYHRPAD